MPGYSAPAVAAGAGSSSARNIASIRFLIPIVFIEPRAVAKLRRGADVGAERVSMYVLSAFCVGKSRVEADTSDEECGEHYGSEH